MQPGEKLKPFGQSGIQYPCVPPFAFYRETETSGSQLENPSGRKGLSGSGSLGAAAVSCSPALAVLSQCNAHALQELTRKVP